jgi:hypothetical protein
LQIRTLGQAATAWPVADAPGVIAAEPPLRGVDLDALAVDLDPALDVAVLIEPARVLTDPTAAAVERSGLLIRRELAAQTQVEAQTLLVGSSTARTVRSGSSTE